MLTVRQNEAGEQRIDFCCDVCHKRIDLHDELRRCREDVLAWAKIVWRDGEEPQIVHGRCAYGHIYSVPAYSYSGDFHSVSLADVIFNWVEQIPKGTRLAHNGQSLSWQGIEAGCKVLGAKGS